MCTFVLYLSRGHSNDLVWWRKQSLSPSSPPPLPPTTSRHQCREMVLHKERSTEKSSCHNITYKHYRQCVYTIYLGESHNQYVVLNLYTTIFCTTLYCTSEWLVGVLMVCFSHSEPVQQPVVQAPPTNSPPPHDKR